MRRGLVVLALAGVGVLLVTRVWANAPGNAAPGFQGYWMGVDPLDGGDSRRSVVQLSNGRFAVAGRDTVLTLCDGTDRGLVSVDDGEEVGRDTMQSDTLTIRCFNTGASVVLHVHYALIAKGLMVERTTRLDGSPVSTIVFHKVSQD